MGSGSGLVLAPGTEEGDLLSEGTGGSTSDAAGRAKVSLPAVPMSEAGGEVPCAEGGAGTTVSVRAPEEEDAPCPCRPQVAPGRSL